MKTIAGEIIAVIIAFFIFSEYFGGMSWGSLLLFLALALPAVGILVIRDRLRKNNPEEKHE